MVGFSFRIDEAIGTRASTAWAWRANPSMAVFLRIRRTSHGFHAQLQVLHVVPKVAVVQKLFTTPKTWGRQRCQQKWHFCLDVREGCFCCWPYTRERGMARTLGLQKVYAIAIVCPKLRHMVYPKSADEQWWTIMFPMKLQCLKILKGIVLSFSPPAALYTCSKGMFCSPSGAKARVNNDFIHCWILQSLPLGKFEFSEI